MAAKKKANKTKKYITKNVFEVIDFSYLAGTPKEIIKNIQNLAKLHNVKNPSIVLVVDDYNNCIVEVRLRGSYKTKTGV